MSETIGYLSDDWLAAADHAVSGLTPLPDSVIVTVNVRGGAEGRGDVGYRLVLGPDRVRILAFKTIGDDGDERSDVTLTMSYTTASAIARGEIGAQRAFLDGEVRLGGDTTALLGHQNQLSEIDDRLGDLRSRTRY